MNALHRTLEKLVTKEIQGHKKPERWIPLLHAATPVGWLNDPNRTLPDRRYVSCIFPDVPV